jgi:hypothetical protein
MVFMISSVRPFVAHTIEQRMRLEKAFMAPPSLRANGSRERAPDDRLREAIHRATTQEWIASSLRSPQ